MREHRIFCVLYEFIKFRWMKENIFCLHDSRLVVLNCICNSYGLGWRANVEDLSRYDYMSRRRTYDGHTSNSMRFRFFLSNIFLFHCRKLLFKWCIMKYSSSEKIGKQTKGRRVRMTAFSCIAWPRDMQYKQTDRLPRGEVWFSICFTRDWLSKVVAGQTFSISSIVISNYQIEFCNLSRWHDDNDDTYVS